MRVSLHETRERGRAVFDDGQTAPHIVVPIGGARRAYEQAAEAARDGFDRRERVVKFMSEHAHESLPSCSFLFAQGAAEIGEHKQLMRAALLAEHAAAHVPTPCAAGKSF